MTPSIPFTCVHSGSSNTVWHGRQDAIEGQLGHSVPGWENEQPLTQRLLLSPSEKRNFDALPRPLLRKYIAYARKYVHPRYYFFCSLCWMRILTVCMGVCSTSIFLILVNVCACLHLKIVYRFVKIRATRIVSYGAVYVKKYHVGIKFGCMVQFLMRKSNL